MRLQEVSARRLNILSALAVACCVCGGLMFFAVWAGAIPWIALAPAIGLILPGMFLTEAVDDERWRRFIAATHLEVVPLPAQDEVPDSFTEVWEREAIRSGVPALRTADGLVTVVHGRRWEVTIDEEGDEQRALDVVAFAQWTPALAAVAGYPFSVAPGLARGRRDDGSLEATVRRALRDTGSRCTVVVRRGWILARRRHSPTKLEKRYESPVELLELILFRLERAPRQSDSDGQRRLLPLSRRTQTPRAKRLVVHRLASPRRPETFCDTVPNRKGS